MIENKKNENKKKMPRRTLYLCADGAVYVPHLAADCLARQTPYHHGMYINVVLVNGLPFRSIAAA